MPIRLRPLDLPTLDTVAVDAYAIFVAEDERPLFGLGGLIDWRLSAGVSRYLRSSVLDGKASESFLMPTGGLVPGGRLFAFGLGPSSGVTPDRFAALASRAASALQRAQVKSLAIGMPEFPPAYVAARPLVNALHALSAIDISLFGVVAELANALPELKGS
jgi:hypothetical protein